jgi:hypothetical protein
MYRRLKKTVNFCMKNELPPHFVVQIALTSMLKRASKGKGSDLKSELCQGGKG